MLQVSDSALSIYCIVDSGMLLNNTEHIVTFPWQHFYIPCLISYSVDSDMYLKNEENSLLHFHGNSCYTNVPHRYIICKVPVFLYFLWLFPCGGN